MKKILILPLSFSMLFSIGDGEDEYTVNRAISLQAPGLAIFKSYVGKYGVSTSGFGSTSNSGLISTQIPKNSEVVAAYLYSAGYAINRTTDIVIDGLKFDGKSVTFSKYYNNPWKNSNNISGYFKTGRADVTNIVKDKYSSSSSSYNFAIQEPSAAVDGEALVVIYKNASLSESTITILDGGANINGDKTVVSLVDAVDSSFYADMYLGISFSYPDQASKITVNGKIVTENAGGYDDGSKGNGALITVGDYTDGYSPSQPSYSSDHEKYNLKNYISAGSKKITIETINPSQDDNLFLVVLRTKGEATVCIGDTCDNTEPTSTPTPTSTPIPSYDSDGDGVVDSQDECPYTYGSLDNGCVVTIEPTIPVIIGPSYEPTSISTSCDTQSSYNNGYAAGIAYCKANPSICNSALSKLTKTYISNLTLDRWHLLGSSYAVDDFSIFSPAVSLWAFKNNSWKYYLPNSNSLTPPSFTIEAFDGFWIKK